MVWYLHVVLLHAASDDKCISSVACGVTADAVMNTVLNGTWCLLRVKGNDPADQGSGFCIVNILGETE